MNEKQKLKGITGFQEQETVGVSPWMLSLHDELGAERQTAHWSYSVEEFLFEVVEGRQSLWIVIHFPAGGQVAFRAAHCPDGELQIEEISRLPLAEGVQIQVRSTVGDFQVQVEFPQMNQPFVHCKTTLTPAVSLRIPFWPRDLIPLGSEDDLTASEGFLYAKQVETRSGLLYFSLTKPRGGSVFYFQNLSSLNDYCKQTETSLAGVVGGEWPELGLALPAGDEKALEAGKETVLSDAYLIFSPKVPKDDLVMSRQFLDFLAQVYLALPRAETDYIHWPDIAKKSLRDLSTSDKCWREEKGQSYLNAYVGDYETPPESMVQLSVLLPLLEYSDWSGEELPITERILSGLPKFFDRKAGVFGRWLPAASDRLDSSEPQKEPRVMDSWYLYHSLLNLSRLALREDQTARRLFLNSIDYAVRVAHEFGYHWPVFYNLDTLEIIKAETQDGQGGETDVAGIYTHLMLQAWELTNEKRYLEEAKKAARFLQGLGFNMFYQANEVLFTAEATLRLWKETGNELYLNLSYLCLANIFNNVWLWDCDYGYGQYYSTFFALFPLKDAPYTAVYEELDGFAALHKYLTHFDGDAPESLMILLPEFIRCLVYKASFYYPPNLPEEMLTKEPRMGEIEPKLWIPLEDIHDGWEKAGEVGQEVYGAGLPFGLVPRQYYRVPDEKFMVFIDYPSRDFSVPEKGRASLRVLGDQRLSCRLRLMPVGKAKLPAFQVTVTRAENSTSLPGHETPEGHMEYEVSGNQLITIEWNVKPKRTVNGNRTKNGQKGNRK